MGLLQRFTRLIRAGSVSGRDKVQDDAMHSTGLDKKYIEPTTTEVGQSVAIYTVVIT